MVTEQELRELTDFAQEIRIWTIRQMAERGFGHMGGAMSICDLLSVLYGKRMKVCPEDPSFEERDWLVCSKGHAGPAVYAALALKGFFPKEWLYTLNQPGTRLPSHCDAGKTPGIDVTTGSLGRGSQQPAAWLWQRNWTKGKNGSTVSSATARARKDRTGRLQCLRHRTVWGT